MIPEIAAAGGCAVAQRGQQFVTVRAVKEIEITGFYIANAVLQAGQDILLGQVAAQRAAGIVILGAGGPTRPIPASQSCFGPPCR